MTNKRSDKQIARELAKALKAAITRIPDYILKETVYGIALYTTPECYEFALAVNTEESLTKRQSQHSDMDDELRTLLQDHPDLLAKAEAYREPEGYLRVCAAEWGYIDLACDAFSMVNEWALDRYEKRNAAEQPLDSKANLAICETALRSIREANPFTADYFANDVLLCVQYSDMGFNEPELLELATKLNSAAWNEKLRSVWGGSKGPGK